MSSFLGAQIFFDQYNNFSWYLNGLRFRNLIVQFKNQTLETYVPEADFQFITNSLKPRFISLDKEFMDGMASICQTSYKRIAAQLRQVKRMKLASLEDNELASMFLDYYQTILSEVFLVNLKPLEIAAMEALSEIVMERSDDPAQAQRDITALATMDKPSLSAKEEMGLCDIVTRTIDPAKIKRALQRTRDMERLLSRNYPDLFELLDEHHKKYRSLIGGFSEMTWSLGDIIRRYYDMLDQGTEWTEERFKFLAKHTRETSKMKRKILARLKDKGKVRNLAKVISDLGGLAESNRAAYRQVLEIRELLTEEITERVDIMETELRYYNLGEILDLIRSRVRLKSKTIDMREKGMILHSLVSFYDGNEGRRFIEKMIMKQPRKSLLNGRCSSPGLYEGDVRIVRNIDDVEKVRLGDVVIASSNGYEFSEAFRKAGAIVVESGGLIGPASMISREIKVPCLIEVEGALNSFEEGDRVIVDGEGQTVCYASEQPATRNLPIDKCSIKVAEYDKSEASVVKLDEVEDDMGTIFGNKAVVLGRLTREGYQIPEGYALGRSVMYKFLATQGCQIVEGTYQPDMVEVARRALSTNNATDFLRSLPLEAMVIFDEDGCSVRSSRLPGDVIGAESPSTLAVRSLEGLWKGIRKCWLNYLEQKVAVLEKGGQADYIPLGGGVIIQKYKPGDRSGVISTQDATQSGPGSNVIVLDACLGIGHSLRTGKVRCDRYRISRKTERIINRIIPLKTRFEMVHPKTGKMILIPVPADIVENEVLSRLQIKSLVTYALKIEKLLGYPIMMEWTIKGGEIYILNAKPLPLA